MHVYATKKRGREIWGQFRLMHHCAAQSFVTHCKETANHSADVPAHPLLALLDRLDGECPIPYFPSAKLRITNSMHSFLSVNLWQLLGRQILKSTILHSFGWESAEVQSIQLASVAAEGVGGGEIVLSHPNGSLALGGRFCRSQ